jgi:hypothetical protein
MKIAYQIILAGAPASGLNFPSERLSGAPSFLRSWTFVFWLRRKGGIPKVCPLIYDKRTAPKALWLEERRLAPRKDKKKRTTLLPQACAQRSGARTLKNKVAKKN